MIDFSDCISNFSESSSYTKDNGTTGKLVQSKVQAYDFDTNGISTMLHKHFWLDDKVLKKVDSLHITNEFICEDLHKKHYLFVEFKSQETTVNYNFYKELKDCHRKFIHSLHICKLHDGDLFCNKKSWFYFLAVFNRDTIVDCFKVNSSVDIYSEERFESVKAYIRTLKMERKLNNNLDYLSVKHLDNIAINLYENVPDKFPNIFYLISHDVFDLYFDDGFNPTEKFV